MMMRRCCWDVFTFYFHPAPELADLVLMDCALPQEFDGGARGNPGTAGAGAVLYSESNEEVVQTLTPTFLLGVNLFCCMLCCIVRIIQKGKVVAAM